jgi:hypothetical protein
MSICLYAYIYIYQLLFLYNNIIIYIYYNFGASPPHLVIFLSQNHMKILHQKPQKTGIEPRDLNLLVALVALVMVLLKSQLL